MSSTNILRRTVRVSNLRPSYDRKELRSLFEKAGQIEQIDYGDDEAYIRYYSRTDCESSLVYGDFPFGESEIAMLELQIVSNEPDDSFEVIEDEETAQPPIKDSASAVDSQDVQKLGQSSEASTNNNQLILLTEELKSSQTEVQPHSDQAVQPTTNLTSDQDVVKTEQKVEEIAVPSPQHTASEEASKAQSNGERVETTAEVKPIEKVNDEPQAAEGKDGEADNNTHELVQATTTISKEAGSKVTQQAKKAAPPPPPSVVGGISPQGILSSTVKSETKRESVVGFTDIPSVKEPVATRDVDDEGSQLKSWKENLNKTIRVRNLPDNFDEGELRDLFLKAGYIESIEKGPQQAFIQFSQRHECETALIYNEFPFGEAMRPLNVMICTTSMFFEDQYIDEELLKKQEQFFNNESPENYQESQISGNGDLNARFRSRTLDPNINESNTYADSGPQVVRAETQRVREGGSRSSMSTTKFRGAPPTIAGRDGPTKFSGVQGQGDEAEIGRGLTSEDVERIMKEEDFNEVEWYEPERDEKDKVVLPKRPIHNDVIGILKKQQVWSSVLAGVILLIAAYYAIL